MESQDDEDGSLSEHVKYIFFVDSLFRLVLDLFRESAIDILASKSVHNQSL